MLKSLSRSHLKRVLCPYTNPLCLSSLSRRFCSISGDENDQFCSHIFPIGSDCKYKSKVGIISHPSCSFHEAPDHPESPERIKAVMDGLNNPEINDDDDFSANLLFLDQPTQITRSRVTMVHSQIHVDDILERARESDQLNKTISIDGDTFISPNSGQSAMYAAAAVCYAVDIVLNDKEDYQYKVWFF